jgi:rubrerythrin
VTTTRKLIQRFSNVDAEHFRKLKERFEKTSGKEKRLVKGEIADIEEKLAIEQAVFEIERRLLQALNSFNQSLRQAMERVANSLYPYDAVSHLSQARQVLKGIMDLVQEAKALEERILGLIKAEKNLLKQELKTS